MGFIILILLLWRFESKKNMIRRIVYIYIYTHTHEYIHPFKYK
jgi:hypothetical protein